MVTAIGLKERILKNGVDLCGIASIDRFSEAPQGYHPRDVLPSCRSVVVLAKKFLNGTLRCQSTVPYTIIRNILSDKLDKITVEICYDLDTEGVIAVPTGTNGPTEFDVVSGRFRNIVSAKHCGVLAGIGRIGKNTLLVTPQYGNMVWLSVILTDAELEPDAVIPGNPCPEGCSLCIDACPVNAIENPYIKQMDCWNHAFGGENGGDFKIKCFKCREVCPNRFKDTTL